MQNVRALTAALTVAAAAATMVALGPAATAAPSGPKPHITKHYAHATPAGRGGFTAQSASSGAGSGDFTGDGAKDILARYAATGELKVYPHSGTFNGLATYTPASTINFGWNGLRWI